MEHGGYGIGDIKSTSTHLSENDIDPSVHIDRALEIASKKYRIKTADKYTVRQIKATTTKRYIKENQSSETLVSDGRFYSARTFFHNQMPEEIRSAKDPRETLGKESGTWFVDVPVEGKDVAEARTLVLSGLEKAYKSNLDGQRSVFKYSKLDTVFQFEERLTTTYLPEWLEALGRYRDPETGFGHHVWETYLNDQGQVIIRDFSNRSIEKMFEVVEIAEDELEKMRDIKDMTDKHLVGKVLLIKGKQGKVKTLEFLFNHFNNDEEQGRRIYKSVLAEGFNVDRLRKVHGGVQIIREKIIKRSFNRDYLMADLETSFKYTENEISLLREATSLTKDKMNMSVYMSQIWLMVNGGRSGYICVAADKPRYPGGPVSAGLQLAFLPRSEHFNNAPLLGMVRAMTEVDRNQYYTISNSKGLLHPFLGKIMGIEAGFEDLNEFMKGEIERSRKGLSTIGILAAHIPQQSKKLFRELLNKQYRFVSQGNFQISSLSDFHKEDIPNIKFVTALGKDNENAMSVVRTSEGTIVDVRFRMGAIDQANAVKNIHQKKKIADHIEIKNEYKKMAKEKMLRFRMGLLATSANLIARSYESKYKGVELKGKMEELSSKIDATYNQILHQYA